MDNEVEAEGTLPFFNGENLPDFSNLLHTSQIALGDANENNNPNNIHENIDSNVTPSNFYQAPPLPLSPEDQKKRDEFYAELNAYMNKRTTPISRVPQLGGRELDLYQLWNAVASRGGVLVVINRKLWKEVADEFQFPSTCTNSGYTLRLNYIKYLYPFEQYKLFGIEDTSVSALQGDALMSQFGPTSKPLVPSKPQPHQDYKRNDIPRYSKKLRSKQAGLDNLIGYLESPYQREKEWALQVLTVLSFQGEISLTSPNLLNSLIGLLSDQKAQKNTENDEVLVIPPSFSSTPFPTLSYPHRISNILRNISFMPDSEKDLAHHQNAMTCVMSFINSEDESIVLNGLEIISNIGQYFTANQLNIIFPKLEPFLFSFHTEYLLLAIEALVQISHSEEGEFLLTKTSDRFLRRLLEILIMMEDDTEIQQMILNILYHLSLFGNSAHLLARQNHCVRWLLQIMLDDDKSDEIRKRASLILLNFSKYPVNHCYFFSCAEDIVVVALSGVGLSPIAHNILSNLPSLPTCT